MTSEQWKMVKWGAAAVFAVLALWLMLVGATFVKFLFLCLLALGAVGVFKLADRKESEAKAEELRGP